jgi:hypothetical protein
MKVFPLPSFPVYQSLRLLLPKFYDLPDKFSNFGSIDIFSSTDENIFLSIHDMEKNLLHPYWQNSLYVTNLPRLSFQSFVVLPSTLPSRLNRK